MTKWQMLTISASMIFAAGVGKGRTDESGQVHPAYSFVSAVAKARGIADAVADSDPTHEVESQS
jgi:hypothetical protein